MTTYERTDTREEPLLTTNDVATLARLHPEVIRREIRRGRLKAHKLTGRIRISQADYNRWLERNRTGR